MTGAEPSITATRIIFKGWATFGIATIRERDGSLVDRVFEDHGAACCVLPYDPERRVALLVRQKRVGPLLAGVAEDIAEAPAGGLDGEAPAVAAIREAMEEVGVRLVALDEIGSAFPLPGVSTERIHLFLACYSVHDRVGSGGGLADENEHLDVIEVALADLAAQAAAGALSDMKTLVLVQALQLRRPELFQAGKQRPRDTGTFDFDPGGRDIDPTRGSGA